MFYANAMRGYALGAKYGIMEGVTRYQMTTETPKMDESAMQGAIGIIIAVGGVLIALYIIAVVVGSISYAVTSGNIKLSPTWNTTITNIDSQAQATFNLATGIRRSTKYRSRGCASDSNHRSGYPYDRYWCILRPRHLSKMMEHGRVEFCPPLPNLCRTMNTAIA